MKRRNWFRCFFLYTLLFAVLAACLAGPYMLRGKSLVNSGDGMMQHIKALDYYGRWLRSIGRRIMQGDFSLPAYSFAFGYGGDVITTLHYYAVGDPLALLSVFFDTAHIVYLYNVLIVLRLYLAGIAFLFFAFYTIPNRMPFASEHFGTPSAVSEEAPYLTGALLYAFCGFSLYTATRHPFFVNPLIWFPLVLLGVEKAIREKRVVPLALAVAFGTASNFYFFYMIVLLTVCYVVWRLISRYGLHRIREGLPALFRIAAGSVLGVMLSSMLFLPVVLKFLQNPRISGGSTVPVLFGKEYYAAFPLSLFTPFSNGSWTHLGITGIGVCVLTAVLLRGKAFRRYQVLVVFAGVLLCIPLAGYILSGGSYVTNRWSWGIVLLTSWLTVRMWEEIRCIRKKEIAALVIVCGIGLVCMILMRGSVKGIYIRNLAWSLGVFICLILFLLCGVTRYRHHFRRMFAGGMIALSMAALAGNIWFMNHLEGKDNLEGTISMQAMTDRLSDVELEQILTETDPAALQDALQEHFSDRPWNTMGLAVRETAQAAELSQEGLLDRYSGHGIKKNESVIDGLPSVHYYWSLANGLVSSYLDDIANNTFRSYDLRGLDDRALTLALTGTQYYASRSGAYVPYGYERLSVQENPLDAIVPVYRNRYTLPFGYTFANVFSGESYRSMDALERQEAMLQAVMVSDEELDDLQGAYPQLAREQMTFDSMDLPFTFEESDGLKMEENRITVSKAGAALTLFFDGVENAETCLYVQNLHFENGGTKAEIEVNSRSGEKTVTKKTLTVLTPEHDWYAGRHDFLVNTGYSQKKKDAIVLTFSGKGIYTFDHLRVAAQPVEQYASWVEALREDSLENVDFHADADTFTTSRVDGTISLQQPKLLCFAIPWEKGWSVRVDGVPGKLICGNGMYPALPLEAGTHQIELRYRIPGSRAGLGISVLAILIIIILAISEERRGKFRYQSQQEK